MSTEIAMTQFGPGFDTALKLTEYLLGEPFKVAGEIFADQLKYWQWKNRINILFKADRILRDRGVTPRKVSRDFFLPYFQDAGNVEEDSLQEAWAKLLAAVIEDSTAERIAYTNTLKNFNAVDVQVLDCMVRIGYRTPKDRTQAIANAAGIPDSQIKDSLAIIAHQGFFTPTQKRFTNYAKQFLRICVGNSTELDAYLISESQEGRNVIMD